MANNSSKLTDEIHEILVNAFADGLPRVRAAKLANIHENTLANWLKKGSENKSGKFRKLYDAVQTARSTFWESKQSELEQVVYKQALKGDTTISMKLMRVMKLSADDAQFIEEAIEKSDALKERFEQEGILYKQEVTIRQHRPDGRLALDVLERKVPEEWGKYETLKLEIDLQKELKALGLDVSAEDIVESAVDALDKLIEDKEKSAKEEGTT